MDDDERVQGMRAVVTALGSRPKELVGWEELAVGHRLERDIVDALAERAYQQCHPLENITVDPEWRRAMVPVFVKRALEGMQESA
jgi:CO/xanthine dehydrogenase FAD-binding subunit